MKFKAGALELAPGSHAEPVIALDIGFSKTSKSCGVAWKRSEEPVEQIGLRFGACISRVVELCRKEHEVALIIEAPLSGRFWETGNPVERGEFERGHPQAKGTRYWYAGAGAATCLAAVFFLRELAARLVDQAGTISLYEGFISYKREATDHPGDARTLLECFQGNAPGEIIEVEPHRETSVLSIVDVAFGSEGRYDPPPVILPEQGSV